MENDVAKLTQEQLSSLTDKMLSKRKSNLKQMLNVEHRLEKVAELNGALYLNDSRATSLEAVARSMQILSEPMVWVVEASNSKRNFKSMRGLIGEKVSAIVLIGDDDYLIEELIDEVAFIYQSDDLDEAIKFCRETVEEGETVLYSPGCPASGAFNNYAQRGDYFKKILNLK